MGSLMYLILIAEDQLNHREIKSIIMKQAFVSKTLNKSKILRNRYFDEAYANITQDLIWWRSQITILRSQRLATPTQRPELHTATLSAPLTRKLLFPTSSPYLNR
jgi:hypothetical protein